MTVSTTQTAPDVHLASLLLDARRTNKPLHTVPETIVPLNSKAAYAVQDVVARALSEAGKGEIVGWKVGAATPTALPSCAPLHRTTVFESGHDLSPSFCRFHGVEAEIAYSFKTDLPPGRNPGQKKKSLRRLRPYMVRSNCSIRGLSPRTRSIISPIWPIRAVMACSSSEEGSRSGVTSHRRRSP